jgi:hypothetical protein
MQNDTHTRREFLSLLPGLLVASATAVATVARPAGASKLPIWYAGLGANGHPEPRPGIDASRVTPADQLDPGIAKLFDMVREIPQVVDGIHCYCGCADIPDSYSLLSCYEQDGMARVCKICQGEGKLVYRLHKQGKSLNAIRAAIDAEFG